MTLLAPQCLHGPRVAYIGRVHAALHEFYDLLPPATFIPTESKKELENQSTFFMTLALYDGFLLEYSVLFPHSHLYIFPPCVFSFTYFLHKITLGLVKLAPKS